MAQTDSPTHIKNKLKALRSTEGFDEKTSAHIDVILELSNSLVFSKTDTIKILAEQTLRLSEDINYKKGEIASYINLANYELYFGSPDEALRLYETSIQSLLDKDLKGLSIKAHNGMAQAYFIKADYPVSYLNFQQALALAEELDDVEMIIKMGTNLGTMFSLLEDYDQALSYYQMAQDRFDQHTSTTNKLLVWVNLGYLYTKTKKTREALRYLDESITMAQSIGASKFLAFAYLTKVEVYYLMGDYEKALLFFDKTREIYLTVNDRKGEADLYYYSGLVHFNVNDFENAETHVEKSLKLYTDFNLKSGLEKCYRLLYQIHKARGNTAKALTNMEMTKLYRDSIAKEKQIRDISMLKAKDTFNKNKIALAAETTMELAEQSRYIQWATLGFVSALLLSVFAFRSANKKKLLNKELTLKAMILSQKKEALDKINRNQDKLFSIVGEDLREPIVSLKQLLEQALKNDRDIQHFYKFGPDLKTGVNHIHFTLDNLLNWGLLQMQGSTANRRKIQVAENINEILAFSSESYQAKNISIIQNIDTGLSVSLDSNHFSIIFRNIISNAIKFTPNNGSITISGYASEGVTTIMVEDSGIGMTGDIIDKVLNNTEHYTTLGTNKEQGTGLGLVLCKELIKKNEGEMEIISTLGNGTRFLIRFNSGN